MKAHNLIRTDHDITVNPSVLRGVCNCRDFNAIVRIPQQDVLNGKGMNGAYEELISQISQHEQSTIDKEKSARSRAESQKKSLGSKGGQSERLRMGQ